MHLSSKEHKNPFFPTQVKCFGDDEEKDVIVHGSEVENTVVGYVGGKTACIYRVERQGSS